MRYALTGGQNANAENVAGFTSCPPNRAPLNLVDALAETQVGLMDSPGHRSTILTPEHRRVSLGVSCDDLNYCWVVQQFQGDYVRFTEPPRVIGRRILSVKGSLNNGVVLAQDSLATIWYDRTPHDLTLGQLDRTCSYKVGQVPVALLRPPAPSGSFYLDDEEAFTWEKLGGDPYDGSPHLPRHQGKSCGDATTTRSVIPVRDALAFEHTPTSFKMQADITEEIARHGAGVYTISIWGVAEGYQNSEPFIIISYPMFVGPP